MKHPSPFCWISICSALFLIAPALASAQDPAPSPPKPEIVTIRSAGGTLDLKGTTSADLLEFTQQCVPWPAMSLTLPLEIEGGPNGSLEQATALLREAVVKNFLVTVEASSDPEARAPRVMFVWGNLPTFEGVIESVGMKYTMFSPSGFPVRATADIRIKEAGNVALKKGKQDSTPDSKKEPSCKPSQQ